MSYIAFDLDALNVSTDVGAACGLPPEKITHGLLRLWAWCFRERRDDAEETHLRGFFGGPEAVTALEAFGFLVKRPGGSFLVRGAEKYLRIRAAQKAAGEKNKTQLVPGAFHKKTRVSRRGASGIPSGSPQDQIGVNLGSPSALHLAPSTNHLTPNTKHPNYVAPKQSAPRETDALCEDFLAATGTKYAWAGAKDGTAFAELQKLASLDEIRARWRKGLRETGWLHVATVAQLRQKWNDLGAAGAARRAGDGVGVGSGPLTATEIAF